MPADPSEWLWPHKLKIDRMLASGPPIDSEVRGLLTAISSEIGDRCEAPPTCDVCDRGWVREADRAMGFGTRRVPCGACRPGDRAAFLRPSPEMMEAMTG